MERKKFKSSPVTRLAKISKSLLVAGGHIAAGKIKNKIDFIQEKKEEFTDTAHKIKAAKKLSNKWEI